MADDKYIKNRNYWRKSYPIGIPRRPPNIITETKFGADGQEYSVTYDLNQIVRHRDYFKIKEDPQAITLGEYDEDLIHFDNEDLKSFSFNFTFSNAPYVVFTVNAADPAQPNTENLNVYGVSKNTTGGVVGLSAPFSGTIRYRAGYAGTFPSYFTGSAASIGPVILPASVFKASFGNAMPDNVSYFTASWAPLAGIPTEVYQTPYDDNGNYDGDTYIDPQTGTLTNSSIYDELSAHMSSSIYFMAVE